jgi:hypothetical protein
MPANQDDQWNIKRAGVLQKRGTHKNDRFHSRYDHRRGIIFCSLDWEGIVYNHLRGFTDMYSFGLLGLDIL